MGITVRKQSFEKTVKNLAEHSSLIYLHEKGQDIRSIALSENVTFVLGDFLGLPKKTELFLDTLRAQRVSLGPASLFASHCITIAQNELDRRQ